MNYRILHAGTLAYYDGIQIFEGRSEIGGHYLGVMIPNSGSENPSYAIVGLSPLELQGFRLGQRDLRDLMVKWCKAGWWLAELEQNETEPGLFVDLTERINGEIPEQFLPESGFTLDFAPAPGLERVAKEARARNTLALELTVESLVASDAHRLRSDSLGGLLVLFGIFVKRALRKEMAKLNLAVDSLSTMFDVAVPAAAGSFRVVLVPAQLPGLFGESDIRYGLNAVDYLLANIRDPNTTLERVKEYSGHTASAFLKLLDFIVTANLTLSYAWQEPKAAEGSTRQLSYHDAGYLLSILSGKTDLSVERITITGRLWKFDDHNRTWGVESSDGKKNYTGKSREGINLLGLRNGTVYVFKCEEEAEENIGTGRETRTLYLVETPIEVAKKD